MTALREELIGYVKIIPEEKLTAIQPLLFMLTDDSMLIEKLDDSDLTEDERKSFEIAEHEYMNGVSIDFDDYLLERGII
jgi:adenylate kinase